MNPDAFVSVFERESRLYLLPVGRTIQGGRIGVDPVIILDGRSVDAIGEAIVRAMQTSRTTRIEAPAWKTYRSPLLKAANVRSTKQFFKGVKGCGVHLQPDAGTVKFLPVVWLDRHNYSFSTEGAVELPASSEPRELALAIISQLDAVLKDGTYE